MNRDDLAYYTPGLFPSFATPPSPSQVRKESFEKYMHAFMSLVSLEGVGCTLEEKQDDVLTCELEEENGWTPSEYFELLLKTLNAIKNKKLKFVDDDAKTDKDFSSKFTLFIDEQITQVKRLIEFDASDTTTHLALIKKYLAKPNDYTLYPWGPSDHQVYFELLNTGKGYQMTIFDLGAGRTEDPVRGNYSPIIRTFTNFDQLAGFFTDIVLPKQDTVILDEEDHRLIFDLQYPRDIFETDEEYKKAFEEDYEKTYAEAAVDFYDPVYGNREICRSCVAEVPQTTGNCVVKNLLAAMKKDAYDRFGDRGGKFFVTFYVQLLKFFLKGAVNNSIFLAKKLKPIEKICKNITDSQLDFIGITCDNIKKSISSVYNELVENTKPKKVKPSLGSEAFEKEIPDFENFRFGT